jgi:hypothetical protein
MLKFTLTRVFAIALTITIVLAGFGNAVLYLWNGVIPSVFGLHALSYWQAVQLLCLCWILFGSWRALPRLPNRADHARDHRHIRLSESEKEATRRAVNNQAAK